LLKDEEIASLDEVYAFLQRDAKNLLGDLLSGISVWRFNAWVAFFLCVMGAAVGSAYTLSILFGTPLIFPLPVYVKGPTPLDVKFKLLLLYWNIAAAAFLASGVAAFVGYRCRSKYRELRKRYSDLYAIAQKLR
jgi:hypothetical protein